MKASEIKVGALYRAKVNGKLTTVRVDRVEARGTKGQVGGIRSRTVTLYHVTNVATGRTTTFRSAAKFREVGIAPNSKAGESPPQAGHDGASQNRDWTGGDGPDADRDEWVKLKDAFSRREAGQEAAAHLAGMEAEMGGVTAGETEELLRSEKVADQLRLEERDVRTNKTTRLGEHLRAKQRQEQDRERAMCHGPAHLVIRALAGTGKTTTLVGGLQVLKGMAPTTVRVVETPAGPRRETVPITPSPQQQAIWDAIAKSKAEARTCAFVAFNKSIAEELKRRIPQGCDAMTLHSLGNRAVSRAFGYCKLDGDRVKRIIEEILEIDLSDWQVKREMWDVLAGTETLVRLVKQNLVPVDIEDDRDRQHVEGLLQDLVDYYELEMDNGVKRQVFDLAPKVVDRCKEVAKDHTINFDDMIWLPVVLGLPMHQYDLLLVDEAQDLNRCQQALARKAGKRLVLCGDPKQAIYGFAGADARSIDRMKEELGNTPRGCVELPLTVTRRCGKAIAQEARQWVPDFEAHEDNSEGKVTRGVPYDLPGAVDNDDEPSSYHRMVRDGDFILCRVNAPLVSQCFRFLRAGRKATIQGRDVAAGLVSTIKRFKARSIEDLVGKVSVWVDKETAKEQAKKYPSEARVIALQDKADCIYVFAEGAATVDEVLNRIERVFTENPHEPGIRLSSIHKAKGLEANRVFFLRPKGAGCPHPMAKTPWQQEQEMNLCYVACTRAIHELVHVS
jgi:DNA helicase II / ATP-dependent DNA helicase PcrA